MKSLALIVTLLLGSLSIGYSQGLPDTAFRAGYAIAPFWPEVQASLDSFRDGTLMGQLRIRSTESADWNAHQRVVYHQLRGENALRFLELDSARFHLNQARQWIESEDDLRGLWGRNLGSRGELAMELGLVTSSGKMLREALAWYEGEGQQDVWGKVVVLHQLAYFSRTDYDIDQAVFYGQAALSLLEELTEQTKISPSLFQQKLRADIQTTMAAIFTRMGTTVAHAFNEVLSGENIRDSASYFLSLAKQIHPQLDTLGMGRLSMVEAEFALFFSGEWDFFFEKLEHVFLLAKSYPSQILKSEIVAYNLLSGYHLMVSQDRVQGAAASQESLRILRQVYSALHYQMVPPLYMSVVHPMQDLFATAATLTDEATVADFDSLMVPLLVATHALAPGFSSQELDAVPPMENIINRDFYVKLIDMRMKCWYWRFHLTEDVADLEKAWKLGLSLQEVLETELRLSRSAFRIKRILQVGEYSLTFSIGTAYELYQETGEIVYWESAFRMMEVNRALLLRQHLLETIEGNQLDLGTEMLSKENDLKEQLEAANEAILALQLGEVEGDLAELEKARFDAGERLSEFHNELAERYPMYAQGLGISKTYSVEEIRNNFLAPNQALISLHRLPKFETYALILTADSTLFLEISEYDRLNSTIRYDIDGWQDSVRLALELDEHASGVKPIADSLAKFSHLLYQHIWQPIESAAISLPSRLLILPDPSLESLPFHLLLREPPATNARYNKWAYLGNDHAFSYAYSLESLELQAQRDRLSNGRWLGFAPSFKFLPATPIAAAQTRRGGKLLKPLTANQPEVRAIARLLENSEVLTGPTATKSALLPALSQNEFLHLATHAWVNYERPDSSVVAASNEGAGESDHLLSLAEIYQQNIPASMVVLSGCGTSLGQVVSGEGLASLSRAFFAAGAHSVVTSLWSVDDAATRELMEYFYAALADGLPKDQAMQQAQAEYQRLADNEKLHPYYWGAFQVYGEVDSPDFRASWSWWQVLAAGVLLGLIVWLGKKWRQKRQALN